MSVLGFLVIAAVVSLIKLIYSSLSEIILFYPYRCCNARRELTLATMHDEAYQVSVYLAR